MTSRNDSLGIHVHHCPPYFDGLICWPYTKASATASLLCPSVTDLGLDLESSGSTLEPNDVVMITKACLANGEWYSELEESWNNYSLCDDRVTHSLIAGLWNRITHSKEYGSFESFLLAVRKPKLEA